MIRKLILWILVISCAATIFFFSSQEAVDSDKVSYGFVASFIRMLDFDNSMTDKEIYAAAEKLNNVVRVFAHFTIFGVLAFLLYLLFNEYGKVYIKCFLYSTIVTFFYSCTDEFHQSFVPGRSAQISDIITDSLGGICGALVAGFIVKLIGLIKRSHK